MEKKQEDWMTRFYENDIEDEGKDTKNIFADTAVLERSLGYRKEIR